MYKIPLIIIFLFLTLFFNIGSTSSEDTGALHQALLENEKRRQELSEQHKKNNRNINKIYYQINKSAYIKTGRPTQSERANEIRKLKITTPREQKFQKQRSALLKAYENKFAFLIPSAGEATQAIETAHHQELFGDGVSIMVIEETAPLSEEFNAQSIEIEKKSKSNRLKEIKNQETHFDHGTSVVSIINQIAPKAKLKVEPIFYLFEKESPFLINSRLVNCSFYSLYHPFLSQYVEKLYFLFGLKNYNNFNMGQPKLFIQVAGNDGLSITDAGKKIQANPYQQDSAQNIYIAYKIVKGEVPSEYQGLVGKFILVGALDYDNYLSEYTNYPGTDPIIQNNFIMTQGSLPFAMDSNREPGVNSQDLAMGWGNGTSLGVPAITGCAALLMEKFPSFSIYEIKEIILESAYRTFVIGEDTLMSEKEITLPVNSKLKEVAFDPIKYGKGIFSLRNAFVYGQLKYDYMKKGIKKRPQELRIEMLKILEEKENNAATMIQKHWRGKLGRNERKKRSDNETPTARSKRHELIRSLPKYNTFAANEEFLDSKA